MKVGILQNENIKVSQNWMLACQKANVAYNLIDITKSDWFEKVISPEYDFFVVRPFAFIEPEKTLIDERLYIISKYLNKLLYPSFNELLIHENKRFLSYYLKANNIPHPRTLVFYRKHEAMDFINSAIFPLVGKTSIGGSGTGVTILHNKEEGIKYLKKAFSRSGIKRRFGPNRDNATTKSLFKKAINNPALVIEKFRQYYQIHQNAQKNFIILQEYIAHDFEWRLVKIGDSYFGHQKEKKGEKASGTKGINYIPPSNELLDFVRGLSISQGYNSMAFDIFEDPNQGFLVNELQTIFGHVQDHICENNGKPGRFIFKNGTWSFEEGDFNIYESYYLRLLDAIKLYKNLSGK